MEDYIAVNKELWDTRTEAHLQSDFYDIEAWLAGKSSINALEAKVLGDVSGLKVLHLQCHFGQDTLSLARLGADVTGVDLSTKSIEQANAFKKQLGLQARFISCPLNELRDHLTETDFDLVFCSYGVITWHPELESFFSLVDYYLKPGGRFFFAEFHPVLWMLDDYQKDFAYPYFNREAIVDFEENTYGNKEANIKKKAYSWNHGLAEVMGPLIKRGFNISYFSEYDYSPYPIFHQNEQVTEGFVPKGWAGKLPLVYVLEAIKAQ